MSAVEEYRSNVSDIKEGMALAEYNMLREKAMRNEILVQSDEAGNIVEVPARDWFRKLYGEEAPSF